MLWTDIEDIVESLEKHYPDIDVWSIRFTDLHNWVINLPYFDDLPNKSNEKILEAIQSEWIALRNNYSV